MHCPVMPTQRRPDRAWARGASTALAALAGLAPALAGSEALDPSHAATPVAAEAAPAGTSEALTLALAPLAAAMRTSPTREIAEARIQGATAQLQEAYSLLRPTITISGGYTAVSSADQAFGVAAGQTMSGQAAVNLTLFNAAAIPGVGVARRNLAAQRLDSRELERALAFTVARAFLQVIDGESQLTAATRRRTVAVKSVADARNRAKAGLASENDATRARLELATAELGLTSTATAVRTSRLALGELIGSRVDGPLALPTAVAVPARAVSALLPLALAHRQDLASSRLRIEMQQKLAQQTRLGAVPTVGVSLSYQDRTVSGNTNLLDAGVEPAGDPVWSVGLNATWQLYDGGMRAGQAAVYEAAAREALANYHELINQLRRDLEGGVVTLASAEASAEQGAVQVEVARTNSKEVDARAPGPGDRARGRRLDRLAVRIRGGPGRPPVRSRQCAAPAAPARRAVARQRRAAAGRGEDVAMTSAWSRLALPPAAVLVLLVSCSHDDSADPPQKEAEPDNRYAVEVAAAGASTVARHFSAPGSLEPFESQMVSARVAGVIKSIDVSEGDQVHPGQAIAHIEDERFRLAVRSAEANLARAKAVLVDADSAVSRRLDLAKSDPEQVNQEELAQYQAKAAQAAADLSLAQSELERARLDLDQAVITASASGVIQARLAQTGSYAQPGTPLASLVRRDPAPPAFRRIVCRRVAAARRPGGDFSPCSTAMRGARRASPSSRPRPTWPRAWSRSWPRSTTTSRTWCLGHSSRSPPTSARPRLRWWFPRPRCGPATAASWCMWSRGPTAAWRPTSAWSRWTSAPGLGASACARG